jgi:uncharacterized protein
MQYIITAYDGNDDKALERRLAAREEHLKGVEQRLQAGQHLYGAAILDDEGSMVGSMMVVDFPTKAELDEWLKEEPYMTGEVWKRLEIQPCRVAPMFMKLYK